MGKLRVTIANKAGPAQLSRMSVARVLNNQPGVSEETRQRISEAANRLGHVLKNGTRFGGSSNPIGLSNPDITTTGMSEILRGVSSADEKLNYGLLRGIEEECQRLRIA